MIPKSFGVWDVGNPIARKPDMKVRERVSLVGQAGVGMGLYASLSNCLREMGIGIG